MNTPALAHPAHLSYSGLHSGSPEVITPKDIAELRAALERARDDGRRITLRGAGMSLDSQSIGQDLALVMTQFKGIDIDEAAAQVTLGVGVTWAELLEELVPLGLVPKVMVTTRQATVGGTLSANSLSRFSCIYGREGHSVQSLRMMTADGILHTCSRSENSALFFGVIGGYGNLGVIVEITYQLMRHAAPIRVETRFGKTVGTEGLGQRLLPSPDDPGLAKCAVLALHKDTLRQLYTTSRYVSGSWLKRVLLYKPVDALRIVAEMISYAIPWVASFIWNAGFRFILKAERAYRDPVADFTFFTDGNVAARRTILSLRGRYRMLEQTFIIPEKGDLEGFIEAIRLGCRRLDLHPLLFDVTWLPEDEGFLLSSTRGMAGYAVNIAFTGTDDPATEVVKGFFVDLSEDCFKTGGRVHLTKNVFAKTKTLAAMYREGLDEMLRLRGELDPDGRFGSGFLERVMGIKDPARAE